MSSYDFIAANPTALAVVGFILGMLTGSFLNVVIYRLPIMLQREWKSQCIEYLAEDQDDNSENPLPEPHPVFNLLKPDSHCPVCDHRIRAWENIPVISYLLLQGKCSDCRTPISFRYPSVELMTGLLTALVAYTFGASWLLLALFVFTWCLICLTLIDFDHQLLPDNITLPLIWLGLLVNLYNPGLGVPIEDAVLGAIAGYLVLWCFYWIFKILTGKEGMGYGDFKLLAALGAWLGWQSLLPIIILSSLVGAIVGGVLVFAFKRDRSAPMPFGPFLACAGFIMLIWGPALSNFYLQRFVA